MTDLRKYTLPVALVYFCSLTFAGENTSRCPDPRLRQAEIGGDTILGVLRRQGKAVKQAVVKLYFSSSGKTVWVGTTDKDGEFTTVKLPPGSYRLEVAGWGAATVRLNPKLSSLSNGQVIHWTLTLTEDGCIGAGLSMD